MDADYIGGGMLPGQLPGILLPGVKEDGEEGGHYCPLARDRNCLAGWIIGPH